jgi:hypothetical protein
MEEIVWYDQVNHYMIIQYQEIIDKVKIYSLFNIRIVIVVVIELWGFKILVLIVWIVWVWWVWVVWWVILLLIYEIKIRINNKIINRILILSNRILVKIKVLNLLILSIISLQHRCLNKVKKIILF